jgi:hypothetical protein
MLASRSEFLMVVDDIAERLNIERVECLARIREACDRRRPFYQAKQEATMVAEHEMEHS